MRIRAIAAIEPSQVIDGGESGGDNDAATKSALKARPSSSATKCLHQALTLAFEGNNEHEYPFRLLGTEEKLGCPCVSVGIANDSSITQEPNVAESVGLALESVLRFFEFAESPPAVTAELGAAFSAAEATRLGLDPCRACAPGGGARNAGAHSADPTIKHAHQSNGAGLLARMFTPSKSSKRPGIEQHVVSNSLTVADFDLLRVVGKGAFGKVMLVRKKANQDEGRIFAMKVLKKSVIAAKGQTEHTRSERSILCEIRHPYIVRLRYAFQSEEKLYLVTDYYNGGSLFYHLRKSRGFSEDRARFYAAELVLALDHLHANGVIYRDLKLENILMDHLGHIALTDFGLSKENVTDVQFEPGVAIHGGLGFILLLSSLHRLAGVSMCCHQVFNSQLTTFCGITSAHLCMICILNA